MAKQVNLLKEENGFFKVSDDKYLLFDNEKVYLVQVHDLTVPRFVAGLKPKVQPHSRPHK